MSDQSSIRSVPRGRRATSYRRAATIVAMAFTSTTLVLVPSGAALADHNPTHTLRQERCAQAGGQFSGLGANARCTVTTRVVELPAPDGDPAVEEVVRPVGDPVVLTENVPAGAPAVEEEVRPVGNPVVLSETVPAGAPTVEEDVVRGESATTTAAGAPANCRRVNNGNAKQPVEQCDRTEVDTTTTPTTVVTTTTTPMETVTTTTQQQERVVTTTQPTEEVTTTTQQQERVVTTTQPTTVTTVTTTTVFSFGPPDNATLVPAGVPQVSRTTEDGAPIVLTETLPAEPDVQVTRQDGEPTVETEVLPAEPTITVDRVPAEDQVETTEAPGVPIVETRTRTTGTCVKNPGQGANRANAC